MSKKEFPIDFTQWIAAIPVGTRFLIAHPTTGAEYWITREQILEGVTPGGDSGLPAIGDLSYKMLWLADGQELSWVTPYEGVDAVSIEQGALAATVGKQLYDMILAIQNGSFTTTYITTPEAIDAHLTPGPSGVMLAANYLDWGIKTFSLLTMPYAGSEANQMQLAFCFDDITTAFSIKARWGIHSEISNGWTAWQTLAGGGGSGTGDMIESEFVGVGATKSVNSSVNSFALEGKAAWTYRDIYDISATGEIVADFGLPENNVDKLAFNINSLELFKSDGADWLPEPLRTGKVYVFLTQSNKHYRWNGSDMEPMTAIPNATDIPYQTTNVDAVLDQILGVIAIAPTYTAPTSAITLVPATTSYELGETFNLAITQTFNQNDAGAKQSETGLRASAPYSVVPTTSFNGTVTYAEGAIKNNNLGIASPTGHIAAGTVTSPTKTIAGYRKMFYGCSAPVGTSAQVRALSTNFLNPVDNTSKSLVIPVGATSVAFCYPKSLGLALSIKDALNIDVKAAFTITEVEVEAANAYAAVTYYCYLFTPPTAFGQANNYTIVI